MNHEDSQGLRSSFPTAKELGMDVVQAIFLGDVQNGIDLLASVLEHPIGQKVVGEFQSQCKIFIGIGELVNLPGFAAIAQAALAAFALHPDQLEEIGRLALADFQAARSIVLAGDRVQGGCPSDALLWWSQP